MKNSLQYAYSITVFIGVLVTMYFMVDRPGTVYGPLRAVQPQSTYRSEAAVGVDPGLSQLFEVESALSKIDSTKKEQKRVPTQNEEFDKDSKHLFFPKDP